MSATMTQRSVASQETYEMESEIERNPLAITAPVKPRGGSLKRWLSRIGLVAAIGVGYFAYEYLYAGAGTGENKAKSAATNGSGKAALGFIGKSDKNKAGAAARTPIVAAQLIERSDILRLTGTLMADERASVASNISGIAADVRVDRGSVVRKNDVLVQIDPTDAKNKLTEGLAMLDELKARLGLTDNMENFNPEDEPEVRVAKASADLAAANLKRANEMYTRKVISAEAYDQTRTEAELATQRYRLAQFQIRQAYQLCKTAEAKLAILEKAVADTTIRAPFDGWVAEKLVAVGEQISSGMQATNVVTLVRIDPLRLSLTVPQQDISDIQPGQTVRFQVDSFPDQTFTATVRFIAPIVASDTRSMIVEAVVPNPEHMLRPGLFAIAELVLPKKKSIVFVPQNAVERTGDVGRVFVVHDGVAREQIVALGELVGEKVEIRSGLTGKEQLVAHPEKVQDGEAIRP
jgi:RND family efflux transporter MFP subunit